MSLDLKNNSSFLSTLRARAKLLEDIRAFFKERGVLEVETPLLCRTAATDPHLCPITVPYSDSNFYLQTSPEFAMKRLLAAGSGPIYQISKAFRNDEVGRFHNPEFTMLEWYRPGFNHHNLMDEMDALLSECLRIPKAERYTYEAIFLQELGINPHTTTLQQLKACAFSRGIQTNVDKADTLTIDDWLDILMTHCLEPNLGFLHPVMIYDFPASKAALAKIREGELGEPKVAERFEVYVKGVELANGYHELTDPDLQLKRFKGDCEMRKKMGLASIPIDMHLIAALKNGLPSSAGVALGFDRLLMLKLGSKHIQEVMAFTIDRV